MSGKRSSASPMWRALWGAASLPFRDLLAALDAVLASSRRPVLSLLALTLWTGILWFLYVPVHEALHAAGCLVTGGEVRRLEIGRPYGGALLAEWIPAVQVSTGPAGRLAEFTTGRSDLRYLATVAAPYSLSVAFAAPLLRGAARRRSAAILGAGALLTLVPYSALGGDAYEIGSILVTRATAPLQAPPEPYSVTSGPMSLRSDDLLGVLRRLGEPDLPGRSGAGMGRGAAALIVALSALTGLAAVASAYPVSAALERRLPGRRDPARRPEGSAT